MGILYSDEYVLSPSILPKSRGAITIPLSSIMFAKSSILPLGIFQYSRTYLAASEGDPSISTSHDGIFSGGKFTASDNVLIFHSTKVIKALYFFNSFTGNDTFFL